MTLDGTVKVADFGLAELVVVHSNPMGVYDAKSGTLFPIKWSVGIFFEKSLSLVGTRSSFESSSLESF
jgi:hypothetical protein